MKNFLFKNLIIILFLFININLYCQIKINEWSCQTIGSNLKLLDEGKSSYSTNPKFINLFIHIICKENGTDGLSNDIINSSLSLLS